jgi:hypothetical protein
MIADVFYIRLLAIVRARYATYWKGLAYDTGRRGHPVSSKWIYVKGSRFVAVVRGGMQSCVYAIEMPQQNKMLMRGPWKRVGGC